MPEGVIQGGWEYVIAAYSFTATVLSLYALSVVLRLRTARHNDDQETP